jgi:hypothetical protein
VGTASDRPEQRRDTLGNLLQARKPEGKNFAGKGIDDWSPFANNMASNLRSAGRSSLRPSLLNYHCWKTFSKEGLRMGSHFED